MQVIDEEAMRKAQTVDIAKPPMKTVPDEFYPRLVYKYPKEHYRTVVTRPTNAAPTERLVPNEPKVMRVSSEREFKKALEQGWKKEPFLPRPLSDAEVGMEYEE